jgi:hypothetical protein
MTDSTFSKRDVAIRAAEPWLRQGYVIDSVEEDGVILRRPTAIQSLAAGTIGLLFRRPPRSIVLTVDDAGEVVTTVL